METDVVIVDGDNWSGLFINGKLVEEGHSLTAHDVVSALIGHTIGSYKRKWADIDWLQDIGNFPSDLNDVVFTD